MWSLNSEKPLPSTVGPISPKHQHRSWDYLILCGKKGGSPKESGATFPPTIGSIQSEAWSLQLNTVECPNRISITLLQNLIQSKSLSKSVGKIGLLSSNILLQCTAFLVPQRCRYSVVIYVLKIKSSANSFVSFSQPRNYAINRQVTLNSWSARIYFKK